MFQPLLATMRVHPQQKPVNSFSSHSVTRAFTSAGFLGLQPMNWEKTYAVPNHRWRSFHTNQAVGCHPEVAHFTQARCLVDATLVHAGWLLLDRSLSGGEAFPALSQYDFRSTEPTAWYAERWVSSFASWYILVCRSTLSVRGP